MAATRSGFQAMRSALAHPNYRYFAMGNVCSHLGSWIQRVAMGWLVWELTRSGTWLGIVAFADLAPTVLFAPIAGVVADRVNRLNGIRITQIMAMAQATLLWGLTLAGLINIEWLVALALAHGIIMAFNQPIRFAIIPALVDRKDLSSAIGLNSVSFNFARVAGPAVAGLLIAYVGISVAFLMNALSYLIYIVALYAIRMQAPPKRTPRPMSEIPNEMLEGLRYCIRTPGVAPMFFILTVVAVFGRAYAELLPGFADRVFDVGVEGFSMLTSAAGAGAITASFLLAGRSSVVGLMRVVTINVLLLAAALIGFTATTDFWIGLICVVVAGFSTLAVGVGEQTLLQNAISGAIRGRVMSLYGMIARGGPAIGALAMGWASDYVGLRWPVMAGAFCCLLLWLWALRRRRGMTEALEAEAEER
jgi:MFS family permease